jgi:nucleoside-diphosphate-sugar epimerase
MMTKILVTGAFGQIGTALVAALRQHYGADQVLATDVRHPETESAGPFALLDVLDREQLTRLVQEHHIREVYHLAAILSARGEQNPAWAWDVNMRGLLNVLEVAKDYHLKIFFPSSIAAFGPQVPADHTPQWVPLHPTTVYGISKTAGENWCQYYHLKYGVDVRSVRYPGIISYESLPGGGTTDYAIDIFHHAVRGEDFTCFLKEDQALPMLYMPDTLRATLELMAAPADKITVRTSYNLGGMSFTPAELAAEIRKHVPGFKVSYAPDFRQEIAASWPRSIDDSVARRDWGWAPEYDLARMTSDMLLNLGASAKSLHHESSAS